MKYKQTKCFSYTLVFSLHSGPLLLHPTPLILYSRLLLLHSRLLLLHSRLVTRHVMSSVSGMITPEHRTPYSTPECPERLLRSDVQYSEVSGTITPEQRTILRSVMAGRTVLRAAQFRYTICPSHYFIEQTTRCYTNSDYRTIVTHRIASYKYRIASNRIASHRINIASHRIASNKQASCYRNLNCRQIVA